MAEIYDVPENIKIPKIKFDGTFNLGEYQKEVEQFYKDVKEGLMADGYTEKHLGEIIRFPVADGNAEYMVFTVNPVQLVHLPIGDAWEFQYVERLTTADVLEKIRQRKALAEMFSKNKQKQVK